MRTKLSVPRLLNYESSEDEFVTLYGIDNVFDQTYHPQSSSDKGGQTYFSFNPLSTETVMDRLILLECDVEITSPMGSATGTVNPLGRLCPTSWPLNNAIRTLEIRINGSSLSSHPRQWKTIFERLNTNEELRKKFQSYTPTFRDNHVDYFRMAQEKFSDCPFSRLNHCKTDEIPRSEWPHETGSIEFTPTKAAVNANDFTVSPPVLIGPAVAGNIPKYVYKFTEPLLIDLLETVKSSGIHNVNKVEIIITWMNNIFDCMFSDPRAITTISAQGVINTVGLNVTELGSSFPVSSGDNAPASANRRNDPLAYDTIRNNLRINNQRVLVRYAKPINAPSTSLTLPYHETKVYNIEGSDSDNSLTLPLIKETVAPRYGIVHVKRREAILGNIVVADSCFRINKLNLQVNNQIGIFSSMSRQKLWNMSTKNGLDCSWIDWDQYGQSIVIFEFGSDIGGIIPSIVGQFSLQLQVEFENQYKTVYGGEIKYKPELELFLIFEGEVAITPDSLRKKIGYTQEDLSKNAESVYSLQNEPKVGGSLKTNSFIKPNF